VVDRRILVAPLTESERSSLLALAGGWAFDLGGQHVPVLTAKAFLIAFAFKALRRATRP
jgi:hypothetical protein